jgi:hypothetical protein
MFGRPRRARLELELRAALAAERRSAACARLRDVEVIGLHNLLSERNAHILHLTDTVAQLTAATEKLLTATGATVPPPVDDDLTVVMDAVVERPAWAGPATILPLVPTGTGTRRMGFAPPEGAR